MSRRPILGLGLLLVLLAVAAPVRAQTAGISGTVIDETGGVIPGATVTLTGPDTRLIDVSRTNGQYRFDNLTPGIYGIRVTLSGFSPATRGNVIVDDAVVAVPAIDLHVAGVAETVVVSAMRAESRLIDAPATMTVLPGSMLAAAPAQNYGDLLRAVPGLNVIQMSARDVNMTSRQATHTTAMSQLVLVDGRSVYLDFFGLVLWDFLPTNVNDISQIEVVRGPASAVWGANALTGVVNILTKSPRQTPGATSVVLSGGFFDRDVGSTNGRGPGAMYSASATTSQIVNNQWSYRLSAGYFNSDAYARPTGRIPIVQDPRDPTGTVGGADYPADTVGPIGTAFQNRGTSQPKFDTRVDQELTNGRVTYAGGMAGTEGIIHTALGPFHIQGGSVMAYAKMSYSRGPFKFNVFTNIVDAEAPNLLVPNPGTGGSLKLKFKTQTYDVEVGHSAVLGKRHALSYGGNYRRNNFDITLAPAAEDRNEIGGYVQDEILVDRFRFSLGARVDKFGNIEGAAFSPRLSAIFQPTADHSLRVSFNRAFRSPSTINNYLDVALVAPVNLSELSPALSAFPLVVKAVGSELPIGTTPQARLLEESLTAYEFAYTGVVRDRTTVGLAFYINDMDDNINFVTLPPSLDPYTAANPPPGWPLPPATLTLLAQREIFLPRTGFTYLNLGPTRQKGVELSIDHRFSSEVSVFANYSWQGDPQALDDPNPFPLSELALPPTHRFNIGGSYTGWRFLGSLAVNYTDDAFWGDVLTPAFHGFTDSFTLVNGSFGVKWNRGGITTSIKSNNILNRTIQQHVFGDLLRRSVIGEVRLDL